MRSNTLHNRTQDEARATQDVGAAAMALPSALLASVSHDLRNPLSVILGASEVLQESLHLADEDRHAYLRSIRRECVRMDEYIQGLFHATRLHFGGAVQLVNDWIGVDEIVGSAADRLARYREGVRVLVASESSLRPVRVHGAMVEQALLNVLDNAAKFSPPGAAVQLRIRQDASAGTRIEVVDDGPGIHVNQRERIFAMFVSDDPQSHGRAGSGLGLAISRAILRAHGGDVVAVDPGEGVAGARLLLTLPAPEVGERDAP